MLSFQAKQKDMPQLSQTKRIIVKNLFWAALGKITQLLSALLVGVIIARYLGPEKYGLMNYVISYVFLFQTFAIFGLDAIETREESNEGSERQKIIGTAFVLKLITGVIFMALAISTSYLMDADVYTTLLIAIYSLSIILNAFSVIRNYFFAIVQNEHVVKAEIGRTLASIVIKLLLLLMHASLTIFIMAYMFDFVLLSIGYIVVYKLKVGKLSKWTFDSQKARYLLKEAFPLLLTSAAVIVYQRIDQVMIMQMIDDESLGYFSVACRFVEVLVFIPIILAQTITPVLVKARQISDAEYVRKGQQFMNLSVWLSFIAAVLTSLFSYILVRYSFGTAYLPAVAVLQVMSFKVVSVALSNTAGAMLVTEGLQRYAIFRDVIGCLVCILLNLIFIPRYGIIAAAFVAIASNVAAGYLADALIPAYHHLFARQTKALIMGWRDLTLVKQLIRK